jgi:hypothetical protein
MTAQIHKRGFAAQDASSHEVLDELFLLVSGEDLYLSVRVQVLLMVAVELFYENA